MWDKDALLLLTIVYILGVSFMFVALLFLEAIQRYFIND